mgnify:CR=1 FL=1
MAFAICAGERPDGVAAAITDLPGVSSFFLGGIEKRRVLEVLQPHIFFDDQTTHLIPTAQTLPSVHIPFGVVNHLPVKVAEPEKKKGRKQIKPKSKP